MSWRLAIIWTNADPIHWRIYAALWGDGLNWNEKINAAHAYDYGPYIILHPLQWRHNGRDSVSNHQPHDCLLNRYSEADQRNIKAPRHWPLCGEFTGDRWIPRTNGQLRGKCFYLMTSSCQLRGHCYKRPTPDNCILSPKLQFTAMWVFLGCRICFTLAHINSWRLIRILMLWFDMMWLAK